MTDTTPVVPPRHRLTDEYAAVADHAWVYSRIAAFALLPVALTVAALLRDQVSVKAALVAGGTAVIYWIRERRYQARHDWIITTPNWWEHMEHAPTLLVFPRTVTALRSGVARLVPAQAGKLHRLR